MAKLEKMNRDDLEREKREAEARLAEIEKAQSEYDGRRVKELRVEITEMLQREGYSIDDVFGGRAGKRAGRASKGRAKYRHPENPEKTWSGRGRQPQWYKDAVDGGMAPEELAI